MVIKPFDGSVAKLFLIDYNISAMVGNRPYKTGRCSNATGNCGALIQRLPLFATYEVEGGRWHLGQEIECTRRGS